MPTARKLYILTQDGQIQGATYNKQNAEQWLGLGDTNDYVSLVPEGQMEETPETAREKPVKDWRRTKEILQKQDKIQERMNRLNQRWVPKSPLLQTPED